MDLLEILLDLLLLRIELSVDGRGQVLVLDDFGLVALVDDDALGLEALGDGLEVKILGEHGLVDIVDLDLGALKISSNFEANERRGCRCLRAERYA